MGEQIPTLTYCFEYFWHFKCIFVMCIFSLQIINATAKSDFHLVIK